jgi:hypothetical protein
MNGIHMIGIRGLRMRLLRGFRAFFDLNLGRSLDELGAAEVIFFAHAGQILGHEERKTPTRRNGEPAVNQDLVGLPMIA